VERRGRMRVLLLILLLAGLIFAEEPSRSQGNEKEKAGEVVKKQGRVKVFKENSLTGVPINHTPWDLFVKDILKTDFASMAFVKLLGYDKLVLMENSVLYIEGIDRVNFENGRALFKIRKREEATGLKVRVKSVIIGIKGTRFAVVAEGEKIGIFLKDGELSVKKMVGEFIRYRKREEEAFEEFKREIEEGIKKEMEEFEEFKRKTEEEFREFVKEFTLKPGQAVMIVGSEVRDVEIPDYIEEEFRYLDMF
jgi:hypothetical protein